jgi:hypothetical protein
MQDSRYCDSMRLSGTVSTTGQSWSMLSKKTSIQWMYSFAMLVIFLSVVPRVTPSSPASRNESLRCEEQSQTAYSTVLAERLGAPRENPALVHRRHRGATTLVGSGGCALVIELDAVRRAANAGVLSLCQNSYWALGLRVLKLPAVRFREACAST